MIPHFERSRVTRAWPETTPAGRIIGLRDLDEIYRRFNIHAAKDKTRLRAHDIIIWLHPVFLESARTP